jgi:hypothetical protein
MYTYVKKEVNYINYYLMNYLWWLFRWSYGNLHVLALPSEKTLFISTMFLRFIAYGCEQVKEKNKRKKSYKREKLVCQQRMIECASSSCTGSASIVEGPLFRAGLLTSC